MPNVSVDDDLVIDHCWQYLSDRDKTKGDESSSSVTVDSGGSGTDGTVYATPADPTGDERSSFLPSSVGADAGELTELQRSILESAGMRRHASKVELAAAVGCSPSYVVDVIGRWYSDHPGVGPECVDSERSAMESLDKWVKGSG